MTTTDRPRMLHLVRRLGAGALAAVALTTLAGCSGGAPAAVSGGSSPASTAATSGDPIAGVKEVPSISAMLPAAIKSKGTLTIAGAPYPPAWIESTSGTPDGWDIANTKAIAAVLGLKVEFKPIAFDGVVPGLQAGRYDGAAGEIYITDERTKLVTFVSNHSSSMALLIPATGSKITSSPDQASLCGLSVGAELASAESQVAAAAAKQCAADGKPKLNVQTFKDQASVNLALTGGRIDAAVGSASQVAYTVTQTGGKFKLVDAEWGPKYDTGLALSRNADTAKLAEAVKAATDSLIKDGTLQKILDKFNGGVGMVDEAKIEPASAS